MKTNKSKGLSNQVRGIFSIERRRNGQTRTIEKNNMVVNVGLDALLQPAISIGGGGLPVSNVIECARILKVSNDASPVTPETIDIGTIVASKNTSLLSKDNRPQFTVNQGMAEDADGKYLFTRNEWVFEPGEIPSEICKVGVYSIEYTEFGDPVEHSLYAATLLTDSNGDVAALTPFEEESFAIVYESRWYLPSQDVVITDVDMKAIGLVDITVRAVGIPADHLYAIPLLAATSAQFSYNVLKDYMPDVPPAIVFSSSALHAADVPYEDSELFLPPNNDDYTVVETSDLVDKTITVSVHLGRNQIWPEEALSAVLYTSRGIYFLGFNQGIAKAAGSRRTIALNLTFQVGRKA